MFGMVYFENLSYIKFVIIKFRDRSHHSIIFSFLSGNLDSCRDCHQNVKTLKVNTMNRTISLSRNHLQMHDMNYTCDTCNYKAAQEGDLKKHQQYVHEGMKYACD